jgi:NAD(P)H-flavin reductase
MPLIHIEQWPQPIEARRLRILEAALDAGVPFPHGCGSGECGTCKCELLSGDVDSDRFSPDALSAEEVARGLILACRSRPKGDVALRWLSAATPLPMQRVDAVVQDLEAVSHDIVRVVLAPPAGQSFTYRAGQFAKLRFARLPVRSYSMATAPGGRTLEFHVRIYAEGKVSPYVANDLQIGERVEVRGPFGDACWGGACNAHVLLLAGGTGLAPIMSILDTALRDGQPPERIHLYHGVRSVQDLYAGETLLKRAHFEGFRFVPVFSEQRLQGARHGHLHTAVADDFASLASALIHVAGPPPMVEAVRALAARRGLPHDRVKADAFEVAAPEKRSLWERITAWGESTLSGL